jgi:hypothetical protein
MVESQVVSLSVEAPFPQILSHIRSEANHELSNDVMVTNGDKFMFLKLIAHGECGVSKVYSLSSRMGELDAVARVLKALVNRFELNNTDNVMDWCEICSIS